jgi:hypothetical protein
MTLDRQLGRAQCMGREYVFETGADLGIWGGIKQYWFCYKKDDAYLLARNGEVVGEQGGPVPNLATGSRELNAITPAIREAQQ